MTMMSRKSDPRNDRVNPTDQPRAGGVLVVCAQREPRDLLVRHIKRQGLRSAAVDSASKAVAALAQERYDVVVIHTRLADIPWSDAVEAISKAHPTTACAVVDEDPDFDISVRAMRAGAADVFAVATRADELAARLDVLLSRARLLRERSDAQLTRERRLRSLCRRLGIERRESKRRVGEVCNNLSSAYRDMAGQLAMANITAEFRSLVRQELELESLLRTGLEFFLSRIGTTNAAIFLPSTSGDFSLGAYVNFDCPGDSAEFLLDKLADTLAPRFEQEQALTHMMSNSEIDAWLEDNGHWLHDRHVIVYPCRHDGECLAVMAFFRGRSNPFDAENLPIAAALGEIFSRQLARLIRVHHRHLPKHKWGTAADPHNPSDPGDDLDLAA
jgi:DNA-binding response OmpR family regulator